MYARRGSQALMFQQAYRMLPTLWNATRVTKEKLDVDFVKEEFMRVNGHQHHHLLHGDVAAQIHQQTHWHHLHSTLSWAESGRAHSVSNHTPLTQRCADVARMHDSVPNVRTSATAQALVLEHISRQEGIFLYEIDVQAEEEELDADDGDSKH